MNEPGKAAEAGSPTPRPRVEHSPIRRRPFLAWLVSGPPGRLVGFVLDVSRELWRMIRS